MEKQKTLVSQAKTSEGELKRIQDEARIKFKDRVVEVPKSEQLSIKTIIQWMILR